MTEDALSPGDIVWIDSSPTSGTEQSGRRPVIVLSNAAYNAASGRALLAPITSRVRHWPFEVALPPSLAVAGVIVIDQVRMVDWRAREAKRAGAVPGAVLDEALAKLAALIERP